MKQILKENGGLPASILWTLAIVAGISVANLYYNQPLLNMIRHELGAVSYTHLDVYKRQVHYDSCQRQLPFPFRRTYQSA